MRSPIQQTAQLTTQSPPDAPSAMLSKQQEVDLVQYPLTCKECSLQRDQLDQQVKDQQEIISRHKIEIDAAKKSAKGGSVWQRTVRIAKWERSSADSDTYSGGHSVDEAHGSSSGDGWHFQRSSFSSEPSTHQCLGRAAGRSGKQPLSRRQRHCRSGDYDRSVRHAAGSEG